MKRKLFIIIITFFIASCICPGAHRKAGIYEVDIKELNDVKFYKIYTYYFYEKDYTRGGYTVEPNISNVITNADTLGISFNFNLLSNKIGFNSTSFSLINSAYACSIGGDVVTFKNKIDSILITSDVNYNGIEAGSSLNSFFFKQSRNEESLSQYIAKLNQEGGATSNYKFSLFLATNIKSGISTNHKFYIKVYKSNSEVIEGETSLFAWY